MRLDPRKVRFVPPIVHLELFGSALRFVGRENTFHLHETALVAEGNMLKVGLLGLERFFRRALAEWSSITIPYARINSVRFVRFPPFRIAALVVCFICLAIPLVAIIVDPIASLALGIGTLIPFLLGIYVFFRVPGRYVIRFRTRDGRPNKLMFRITSKKLRAEFDERLQEYRDATAQYESPEVDADPLVPPRVRGGLGQAGIALALFLVIAGLGITAYVLSPTVSELYGGRANGPGIASNEGKMVPEITPAAIEQGLVGTKFTIRTALGKRVNWTIEPGELKKVEILRMDKGEPNRTVEVRIVLESSKHIVWGELKVSYMKSGANWLFVSATPINTRDGKVVFEVTDK